MEDKLTLLQILNSLGYNEKEVASTLLREGCKGTLHSAKSCPVAVYLAKKGVLAPAVSAGYIVGGSETLCFYQVPYYISNFIESFDKGKYPSLVITDLPTCILPEAIS